MLHKAVYNGHLKMIRFLLFKGANINAKDVSLYSCNLNYLSNYYFSIRAKETLLCIMQTLMIIKMYLTRLSKQVQIRDKRINQGKLHGKVFE